MERQPQHVCHANQLKLLDLLINNFRMQTAEFGTVQNWIFKIINSGCTRIHEDWRWLASRFGRQTELNIICTRVHIQGSTTKHTNNKL